MNPTGSTPQAMQILRDAIPDIDLGATRYTVLTGPADRDLQEFFHDHVRANLPDLQRALAEGDWTALYRHGHSMKGSGGSVGYPEISALSEQLEEAANARQVEKAERLVSALAEWLAIQAKESL